MSLIKEKLRIVDLALKGELKVWAAPSESVVAQLRPVVWRSSGFYAGKGLWLGDTLEELFKWRGALEV